MKIHFSFCAFKIITFILITVSLTLTGCALAPSVPATQNNLCVIFEQQPKWFEDAVEMKNEWGTPISLAMAFVKQESSFRHDARPIKRNTKGKKVGYKSSAYGYAQALDGTWEDFKKATNRRVSRTDFADALQFIGWYTSLSNKELKFSYKDVSNHYLAYHEGRGGFKRGRHIGKTALLNIAAKVEKQAMTYKKQLNTCSATFDKNTRFGLLAKNKQKESRF